MKQKEREFYAHAMAELPRILLGCERGNVRYARLGLIKWLKCSPRKALRGKLPVRYERLILRFAVNGSFFLDKWSSFFLKREFFSKMGGFFENGSFFFENGSLFFEKGGLFF